MFEPKLPHAYFETCSRLPLGRTNFDLREMT